MSASRDKTQKITFIYSNLYQTYRRDEAAKRVIKTENLKDGPIPSTPFGAQIRPYQPIELLTKRLEKPLPVKLMPANDVQNDALNNLKSNLKNLNQLHERLKFMLKELEDLVKE